MCIRDRLNVGLNDTAAIGQKNGRHQLDIDGFEYGLERLINEMNSQTNVFVIGLTPVDESKMPFAGCLWYSNDICNSYERRMEEVCLNQNVPFLPTFREMYSEKRSKNWITHDGIHLNSEGLNDTAAIGQINGRHQLDIDGFEYGLERLINEMNSLTLSLIHI